MPKSNQSCSPPLPHAKPASDESTQRLSDVALRKKKNADAQAAFRARRANYIATLEETGRLHSFSPRVSYNLYRRHQSPASNQSYYSCRILAVKPKLNRPNYAKRMPV
jgi:hypothetical protein